MSPSLSKRGPWLEMVLVVVALLATTAALATPKLVLDADPFDFGEITSATNVTRVLRFCNQGSAPLEISRLSSNCPCFEAVAHPARVEPGECGLLHITALPETIMGKTSKVIYIGCNDPDASQYPLTVTAAISDPVLVEPTAWSFGALPAGATAETTLTVRSATGEAFDLLGADLDSERFIAELLPVEDETGTRHVRVYFTGQGPAGDVMALLQLHTSHPALPSLAVRLHARIEDAR